MPRLRHRLAALVLIAALPACSGIIVQPPAPQEPVSVFVLDHGKHSSLLLPHENGSARYSYGDWDYYALGRTGLMNGLRALFVPTAGAFGRQLIEGARDIDTVIARLSVGVERSIEIRAEAALVQQLRESLDARFAASLDTHHYSAPYDVDFVVDPRPYTLANNSNRVVGQWLTELGCSIRGLPVLSGWRMTATAPQTTPR